MAHRIKRALTLLGMIAGLTFNSQLIPLLTASSGPDFTSLKSAADQSGLTQGDLALIDALQTVGVQVGLSDGCRKGIEGLYHPGHNILVLCEGVEHSGGIGDTLRHEAVHAVQDCAAGLSSSTMEPIFPAELNPFTSSATSHDPLSRFIEDSYPDPERHAVEYEAWASAGSLSSEQVSDLVQSHCN